MRMKHLLFAVLALALLGGCAKKAVKPSAVPQQPVAAGDEQSKDEPSIRFADWEKVPDLKTVLFDYDASEITPEGRQLLQKNAGYLKMHPEAMVLVEGHCDERGTTEYNLTLGQRRAAVVREYYGQLGVPLSQVGTISFGKEKPEDPGHSDEAWAKNRRAETKVRAKR